MWFLVISLNQGRLRRSFSWQACGIPPQTAFGALRCWASWWSTSDSWWGRSGWYLIRRVLADVVERAGWWLLRLGFESKFMLFALLFGRRPCWPAAIRNATKLECSDCSRSACCMVCCSFLATFCMPMQSGASLWLGWARCTGSGCCSWPPAFCWHLAVTTVVHSFEVRTLVCRIPTSVVAFGHGFGRPGDPAFIALETEVVRADHRWIPPCTEWWCSPSASKGFSNWLESVRLVTSWAVADPKGVMGYAPSIPTLCWGFRWVCWKQWPSRAWFRNAVRHTDHPGPRVGFGAAVTGAFCEFGPLAR